MQDYEGTGLTNNLLQIEVTGDSDAEAVARAEALADAFVADHVRRIQEAANAEAKALLDQRDRMQERTRPGQQGDRGRHRRRAGPKASANMESLFARRAELTSRISDFDQRAAEARIGTPQLVAGTQIVDAPRAVRHSLPRTARHQRRRSGSSSGSSSGSRWPRSARWWRTAPCCAGTSRRTSAPRSSPSCPPPRPAGCGGADGTGRHGHGSPRRWPAPCAAPRSRCRCWNWAVRAARA